MRKSSLREELLADNSLFKELDYFLGSRHLASGLRKVLKNYEESYEGYAYRGMLFPRHLLKVGGALDGWHSSTHWSKDEDIARGFIAEGYIPEDYLDELNEDTALLKSEGVTNATDLFVKALFLIDNPENCIDVHTAIEGLGLPWEREQELLYIGYDFEMLSIVKPIEIDGVYIIVVSEIIKR